MLTSLSIKNYALLVDVEVRFDRGLNIITGETGSGKTIILSALGTILGERVASSALRSGAPKAVVEGWFSIERDGSIRKILSENEIEQIQADQIVIRREIYDNGRSRAFVNDTPVQLTFLEEVGELLVDLHGQHDHQSLLKVRNHIDFLDQFGNLETDLKGISADYDTLQDLFEKKERLKQQEKTIQEKKEFYTFQLNEIKKVNPTAEEEEELIREEKILMNSEQLFTLTNELYTVLYEDESSVFDRLCRANEGLEELATIDENFAPYRKEGEAARIAVEELAKYLQKYNSNIEFNHERLEEIERRLADFAGLKKKYGTSISDVVSYREKIESELAEVEGASQELEKVEEQIEAVRRRFSTNCIDLSQKRKSLADKFQTLVPEVLAVLGIAGTKFECVIKHFEEADGIVTRDGKNFRANSKGIDFIEFYVSTNPGEDVRPLSKVASGGEISRIMLALKSIAAQSDQIPVLIFDEIDMGISGRIAQAVGRKLKELSQYHQIICITHLPQIASLGDHHYLVQKERDSGRAETHIKKLSTEERTEAIAMLLSGDNISETHLKSAKELLQDSAIEG